MQSKTRSISQVLLFSRHSTDLPKQIEGVTQKNKFGFKFSQNKKQATSEGEMHHMSMMSIEVHGTSLDGISTHKQVNTRGSLLPNPEEDSIVCIFWCIEVPQYRSVISEHDSRFRLFLNGH